MSEPQPVSLADLPAILRAKAITDDDLADAAADPYRFGESPAEADDRKSQAHAARIAMWRERLPTRFGDAAPSDLTPAQNPNGVVSMWWTTDHLTLILRSEDPGVGKTHAAYAVANSAVLSGNVWAAAWSMVDLNDAFRPGNDPSAYEVACECDLLLLDDMGRERVSEWTVERLQGLLDHRWREGKRNIVTTNLTGEQFLARYGDPIVDRLTDRMVLVVMAGESRRRPAPW